MELRDTDDRVLVARYVRDCDAEFGRDPPSSVRLRTSLDLMENETSARAAIYELPDLLDDFEVWVHPASAQQRVIGDRSLSALANEVDGLYVAYAVGLRSFDSGRNQSGTVLMEDWIAAWQAGSYVVTVQVSVEDRNYMHLTTARLGVVSSRTFDGWHLLGRIGLDLVNGWPLESGRRPLISPAVTNYGALLRQCAAGSELVFEELVRERVLGQSRMGAVPELFGVQIACVHLSDPARRADLESRAARSGNDVCETLRERQLYRLTEGQGEAALKLGHLFVLDGLVVGCVEQYGEGRLR